MLPSAERDVQKHRQKNLGSAQEVGRPSEEDNVHKVSDPDPDTNSVMVPTKRPSRISKWEWNA